MGRIILPSPHNSYVGTATTYDMSGGLESQDKFKLKAGSVRAGLTRETGAAHTDGLGTGRGGACSEHVLTPAALPARSARRSTRRSSSCTPRRWAATSTTRSATRWGCAGARVQACSVCRLRTVSVDRGVYVCVCV